jgi:hypothetical protein
VVLNLFVAIQACLLLAAHWLADEGWDVPQRYGENYHHDRGGVSARERVLVRCGRCGRSTVGVGPEVAGSSPVEPAVHGK